MTDEEIIAATLPSNNSGEGSDNKTEAQLKEVTTNAEAMALLDKVMAYLNH